MLPMEYSHNIGFDKKYYFKDFSKSEQQHFNNKMSLRGIDFLLELNDAPMDFEEDGVIHLQTRRISLELMAQNIFPQLSDWRLPVHYAVFALCDDEGILRELIASGQKLFHGQENKLALYISQAQAEKFLLKDIFALQVCLSTDPVIGKKFVFPLNATLQLNGIDIHVNKELLSGHSDFLKRMFMGTNLAEINVKSPLKDNKFLTGIFTGTNFAKINFQYPLNTDDEARLKPAIRDRLGSLTMQEPAYYFAIIYEILENMNNTANALINDETIEGVLFIANFLQLHAVEGIAVEFMRYYSNLPFFEKYRLLTDVGYSFWKSDLFMAEHEIGTGMRENILQCQKLTDASFEELYKLLLMSKV